MSEGRTPPGMATRMPDADLAADLKRCDVCDEPMTEDERAHPPPPPYART